MWARWASLLLLLHFPKLGYELHLKREDCSKVLEALEQEGELQYAGMEVTRGGRSCLGPCPGDGLPGHGEGLPPLAL